MDKNRTTKIEKTGVIICYAHGYVLHISAHEGLIEGTIQPLKPAKPFQLVRDPKTGNIALRFDTEK